MRQFKIIVEKHPDGYVTYPSDSLVPCHPELVSGSRFWFQSTWVLKPCPVGGVLYSAEGQI